MFEAFVKSSQQSAIVKEWQPWWLSTDNKPGCIDIQEMTDAGKFDETINLNDFNEEETTTQE